MFIMHIYYIITSPFSHVFIFRYSRKVLWLKAGHTNNNPKYVASYFMDYVQDIEGE